MEVLAGETTFQQERLQAIAEKRKRQAEIENKRRQLEDDRRQLQHLKSKALRERWLLEGTPSSASEGDKDMRRQMQEDEQKARHLEESISRWVGRHTDLYEVWVWEPQTGNLLRARMGFGHLAPCVGGAGRPPHAGIGRHRL